MNTNENLIMASGQSYPLPLRGSMFRAGRSIAVIGGTDPSSLADAGQQATQTVSVSEPGQLAYLTLPYTSDQAVALTTLSIDNDNLITGHVPACMFAANAARKVRFDHYVDTNSTIEYAVLNNSGAAVIPGAAWTVEAAPADARKQYAARAGRSLVAIGGPTVTSVAASSTATMTYSIEEAGVLCHLVIAATDTGDLNELLVTSIKLNNDELITGSVPVSVFRHDSIDSPLFGHKVDRSTKLSITVENKDGATAASVYSGFSVL